MNLRNRLSRLERTGPGEQCPLPALMMSDDSAFVVGVGQLHRSETETATSFNTRVAATHRRRPTIQTMSDDALSEALGLLTSIANEQRHEANK